MTCVDFVPNDDDIVRGIVAPSALYSTDNEGFVSVAVTNRSDHGMEFDRGDVLLSAYQVVVKGQVKGPPGSEREQAQDAWGRETERKEKFLVACGSSLTYESSGA